MLEAETANTTSKHSRVSYHLMQNVIRNILDWIKIYLSSQPNYPNKMYEYRKMCFIVDSCFYSPFFIHLMSRTVSLLFLLEPIFFHRSRAIGSNDVSLNLGLLRLVCFQFICDVGFLGACWSFGDCKFDNMAFGVVGLDGGWLVGSEFLEVHLLHKVGYSAKVSLDTPFRYLMKQRPIVPDRTAEGAKSVRRLVVVYVWRLKLESTGRCLS
jgi:hypothetical protein